MTNEDISKKRDRTAVQRIHIRNEVEYISPMGVDENPYYRSSPTLVSGVYGKHRFRAVMLFGYAPWAYIEVPKKNVSKVNLEPIGRGISAVQSSTKGVGKAHAKPDHKWIGWAYDLPTDYAPTKLGSKGKKWTTKAILKDIKTVIDHIQ
jgi:hypothetical protein